MASAFFETLGEHGESILATEVVPEEKGPDVSNSGKKKPTSEGAKRTRAKKGEVVLLSSSYTCWRKVPEAWLDSSF